MPVVATMTILALLRSEDGTPVPFFDAELMAEKLDSALGETSPATLEAVQPIVQQLELALKDYRESVDRSLDKIIDESKRRYLGADELISEIAPLDRKRDDTLRGIIELRQSLLEILDEQQWQATFEE